ncbi:MAG: orotate phosphoribosyltransferase [Chloroflexota bacterium]|nr:MAG: orotate phosphoribosyltransferase [Chloroflexota bacterium]
MRVKPLGAIAVPTGTNDDPKRKKGEPSPLTLSLCEGRGDGTSAYAMSSPSSCALRTTRTDRLQYRLTQDSDPHPLSKGVLNLCSAESRIWQIPEKGGIVLDVTQRLFEVLRTKAFKRGVFQLTSGRTSSYYIDSKMATLSAEGAYLTGKAVYAAIRDSGAQAVGGLTMGADSIATAAAIESFEQGNPIPAFFVRKEPKKHGTRKWIEGPLPETPGLRVAIVDDVITTGGSVIQSIAAMEESGYTVCKVIVLVDRMEGGGDELLRRGYDYAPLFKITDFGVTLEEVNALKDTNG